MTNSQTNGTARNGAMAFTITCVVKPFVGAKFDFGTDALVFITVLFVNFSIVLIERNLLFSCSGAWSCLPCGPEAVFDATSRNTTRGVCQACSGMAMEKKLTWLRTDDGWTVATRTTVNFPSPRFIAQKVCFDFCRICSLDSFNSPPTLGRGEGLNKTRLGHL